MHEHHVTKGNLIACVDWFMHTLITIGNLFWLKVAYSMCHVQVALTTALYLRCNMCT